jgi:hypothetical protein
LLDKYDLLYDGDQPPSGDFAAPYMSCSGCSIALLVSAVFLWDFLLSFCYAFGNDFSYVNRLWYFSVHLSVSV